jgi:hypothetical protein
VDKALQLVIIYLLCLVALLHDDLRLQRLTHSVVSLHKLFRFFDSTANLLNGHDGIRTRMVVWQLSGELALAD